MLFDFISTISGFQILLGAFIILLVLLSFETTGDFLKENMVEVLTSIAGIGLTLIDIMSSSNKKFIYNYTWQDAWAYLLVLFGFCLALSIFLSARRNLTQKRIREEIDKSQILEKKMLIINEEYYKLCSETIKFLFQEFFTTGKERISIYKHQGNHFTLLGRYAPIPENNKRTDYSYSEGEGLIGKGWRENEVEAIDIPAWSGKGVSYKSCLKNICQISDLRLNKIRMRSRSYYIKTLDDNSTATDPDGIIVFESIDPNKSNKTDCGVLLANQLTNVLSLLKNMNSLTKKIEIHK